MLRAPVSEELLILQSDKDVAMAVMLRGIVMLLVLVGLPAAWVYYGPLPPGPQRVVDHLIGVAQTAIGWEEAPPASEELKAAPRYVMAPPAVAATPRDQQVTLASLTVPAASPLHSGTDSDQVERQLEPHLSLLRSLGAKEYALEHWGSSGEVYRFHCDIVWGESEDYTRQFEAVSEDPLAAVRQVVGEVTAWQNASHGGITTTWQ